MMRPGGIRILRHLAILAGLLACSLARGQANPAGVAEVPVHAGGPYAVPVTSLKGLRFTNTIHQQFDFSCGSAALATLLTYHYGFKVGEQEVFRAMYERGDQAKIKREGFSLLDIKMYLEAQGFEADGFVAEVDQLAAAGVPAIALVKERGYNHFVVVKGMRGGRILIGDPSAGTRAMAYAKFKQIWANGILFVIHNRQQQARFNTESDWRAAPAAPLAEGFRSGASSTALSKRGPSDF